MTLRKNGQTKEKSLKDKKINERRGNKNKSKVIFEWKKGIPNKEKGALEKQYFLVHFLLKK